MAVSIVPALRPYFQAGTLPSFVTFPLFLLLSNHSTLPVFSQSLSFTDIDSCYNLGYQNMTKMIISVKLIIQLLSSSQKFCFMCVCVCLCEYVCVYLSLSPPFLSHFLITDDGDLIWGFRLAEVLYYQSLLPSFLFSLSLLIFTQYHESIFLTFLSSLFS